MEDVTEHVVGRVMPDVGARQWFLSLPFAHRVRVAFDKKLFGTVVRLFMDEVFQSYGARAAAFRIESAACGGIAFLQRFGSKLNLNVDVHAVVMDDVFTADGAIESREGCSAE